MNGSRPRSTIRAATLGARTASVRGLITDIGNEIDMPSVELGEPCPDNEATPTEEPA